jgi:Protein of unknown function (DUF3349)
MYLANGMTRLVAFFRAGYPTGMPATGYVPLAALLPRRLSDDEIAAIASELVMSKNRLISSIDVGVLITRVTGEMPSPDGIARIQRQLEVDGPPQAFR